MLLAGRRATNLDWKQRRDIKSEAAVTDCWFWRKAHTKWVAACPRIWARSVGANESISKRACSAGQEWIPPSSRSMAKEDKKCWKCGLNATAWAPMSKSAPKIPRRQLHKWRLHRTLQLRSTVCCAKQDDCTADKKWLKIYTTLLQLFATGRQISYASGLISCTFSTGTKACVTSADLIDSDENLHCFTRPLSSCDIKISVVSQCRSTAGISWLFNISTHSLSRFF